MVLGLLTAVAACPAIIGTTEAVRQGQATNAREKHRGRKTNLVVLCPTQTTPGNQIDGCLVVLRHNKLYIQTASEDDIDTDEPSPHPFTGYFLGHPKYQWGWQGEGLVSTIMDDPPQLNWIYVDQDTNEVKYGTKVETEGHLLGPWNCTKIDKRMIFEGWEGFLAVEEKRNCWALYFDREDDGLEGKVPGLQTLEVELMRRERRKTKENADDKNYV